MNTSDGLGCYWHLTRVRAIGPTSTSQFKLVGELAPTGTLTEAFTWLFSAVLAGTTVEVYGAQLALALPPALVLIAATAALAMGPRAASPG